MKKPRNKKAFSDINITPLVDVMLVLLVIFMVTTPMLVKGIKVNLPKTHSGVTKVNKKDLIISIDKNGNYFIDKAPTTLNALKDYINAHKKEFKSVIIKSDKTVQYGIVVHLIDIIKSEGIGRVGLATQPGK